MQYDFLKTIRSFKYAFRGIYFLWKSENNSKVHFLLSLLAISSAFMLNISTIEWLWILLAISLVWICEGINTAIEKLTDLVSPDFNEKAGMVKDIAAGIVLISAAFATITGLIIFFPKLMALI